jgi:hypothetical protein
LDEQHANRERRKARVDFPGQERSDVSGDIDAPSGIVTLLKSSASAAVSCTIPKPTRLTCVTSPVKVLPAGISVSSPATTGAINTARTAMPGLLS